MPTEGCSIFFWIFNLKPKKINNLKKDPLASFQSKFKMPPKKGGKKRQKTDRPTSDEEIEVSYNA